MTRCPRCESLRVVIVLSQNGRSFCPVCKTTWVQKGSTQREVKRAS